MGKIGYNILQVKYVKETPDYTGQLKHSILLVKEKLAQR